MEGLQRAAGIEVLMRQLSALATNRSINFLPFFLSLLPPPSQLSFPFSVTIKSHNNKNPSHRTFKGLPILDGECLSFPFLLVLSPVPSPFQRS